MPESISEIAEALDCLEPRCIFKKKINIFIKVKAGIEDFFSSMTYFEISLESLIIYMNSYEMHKTLQSRFFEGFEIKSSK